jgi:hypothetical protein
MDNSGGRKERKKELARKRLIVCGFCGFNRGENAKRKPKSDKHKNHRTNLLTGRD